MDAYVCGWGGSWTIIIKFSHLQSNGWEETMTIVSPGPCLHYTPVRALTNLVEGELVEREDSEQMSTSGISVRMVAKKSPISGWPAGWGALVPLCGWEWWPWPRGELLFLLFGGVGENSSSEASSSLMYSIRLPGWRESLDEGLH